MSYQTGDAKFVLAYVKKDAKTIRSYKRPLAGSATWSNGLTVYTTPGLSVSAPVLGNDYFLSERVIIGALLYAQ